MRWRVFIAFTVPTLLAAQDVAPVTAIQRGLAEAGLQGVEQTGKCGTPLVFEARRRIDEIPGLAREAVRKALQRPVMQTHRLSPSGRFRIHYDTTGTHQPAALADTAATRVPNSFEQYVDSVGTIFDYCRDVQVNVLGYEAPPSDGIAGGGPEYDVYIQNLPAGVFGYTLWGEGETQFETGDRERSTTYVTIDNDYLGFRTRGWNGLRVTAAHEFYHAIQVGVYGIWNTVPNSDFYFYELTSVWMEDVVYDEINDYYFDLSLYFSGFKDALNRSYSFTHFNAGLLAGYERSVFAHFLERRYDREVMRSIWNGIRSRPALRSMNVVLQARGSSLSEAFAEFAAWNLFTGSKADTIRYYKEGKQYPRLAMNARTQFAGSSSSIRSSAFSFSSQYYAYEFPTDTVIAIVVEKDFEEAYASPGTAKSLELMLSNSTPHGGTQQLQGGITSGFVVENPDNWRTQFLSSVSLSDLRGHSQPFPSPLRLSQHDALMLPADGSSAGSGEVFFLTSSLDLVFSGTFPVTDVLGKPVVRVPVPDVRNRISTGVHFVVLKTREKEYQWKLAVIR